MPSLLKSNFNGGIWSPSMHGRIDLEKYQTAVIEMNNAIARIYGGCTKRDGFQFSGQLKYSDKTVKLGRFQFNVEQSYIVEYGHKYIRFITNGGYVLDDKNDIYEIESIYTEDQLLELKDGTQSGDILYLSHPSHPPYRLCRYGHTNWKLEKIVFGAKINAPSELRRTNGDGSDYKYCVTAVDESGEESSPSNSAEGGPGDTFEWSSDSVATAHYYNVYKSDNDSDSFGWIARANSKKWTEKSNGIDPDYDKSPPEYRNPFNDKENYPACCGFYQQRLMFAKSQKIWASVTGSFHNMNISSPLRDDDSFSFTIDSKQANQIRWLATMNHVIIGTAGSEWILGASNGGALTPSNKNVDFQSNWGCSHIEPLPIGNSLVMIEGSDNVVRDLTYLLDLEGYDDNDLTIFAYDLFDGHKIVDWCYQQYPYSIIWCVRDDGILLGLTYYRKHQIFGWHTHKTDGFVERCECIRTEVGTDDVYFVVRREINGKTVKYLERMINNNEVDNGEDGFYLDSALRANFSKAAKEVSGLEHLEGKQVYALADGHIVKPSSTQPEKMTVKDGKITLPRSAKKIVVGLPYTSKIKTLDFSYNTEDSMTILDRQRSVVSAILHLNKSRGLYIGPDGGDLQKVRFDTEIKPNKPVELFTGTTEKINFEASDVNSSRVIIESYDPVPFNINALIVEVSHADF